MIIRSLRRLTSAHVIALLALFVALGGGAYAAFSLPRASVGTQQLRNHAVTPAKLSSSTKHLLGKRGPQGVRGLTGAPGTPGQTGSPGPSDVWAAGAAFGALPTTEGPILSVTVAPGSYLLGAKLIVMSTGATAATCELHRQGGAFLDAGNATLGSITHTTISMTDAITVTSATTIELDCVSSSGASNYDDARLWAIRTGNLHATLPLPTD